MGRIIMPYYNHISGYESQKKIDVATDLIYFISINLVKRQGHTGR